MFKYLISLNSKIEDHGLPCMNTPRQNSDCFCQELWHECSLKRCCCFLLILLIFIVLAVGMATLSVIFLLKPEKPVFSFQSIRMDWYELNAYSGSVLFASSVLTLTLNAQNPNKVGLRYSPSRLSVYHEGLPIGVIRVPGFFQPAHSNNVSVRTRVLFQCLNLSQIFAGNDTINMTILGNVRAQLWVFHMTLLQMKVPCRVSRFIAIYIVLSGHHQTPKIIYVCFDDRLEAGFYLKLGQSQIFYSVIDVTYYCRLP